MSFNLASICREAARASPPTSTRAVRFLEALPKGPTGKVLKKELKEELTQQR